MKNKYIKVIIIILVPVLLFAVLYFNGLLKSDPDNLSQIYSESEHTLESEQFISEAGNHHRRYF
ncbi:MAG: hypothetical protein A2Y15_06345 [Clostridiales bacterium GWF2_36_10]|nr:MAG: hypothetical protein A2Y15_06345 [Clostridiales bacterium GWF2_36_10]HAN21862.1 hypothetical protein [Clostridiales bacterium]